MISFNKYDEPDKDFKFILWLSDPEKYNPAVWPRKDPEVRKYIIWAQKGM